MTTTAASAQIQKSEILRALHAPGTPLIVTNVWDAVTARIVAGAPGVRAIATASHAVSFAHGVEDGEGLTVEQALETARIVVSAVDLPVSIDFERGYANSLPELESNIARLVDVGAAGLNIEDTSGDRTLFPLDVAIARIASVRGAGGSIVINARADALARGASFEELVQRANAYLDAGADCVFVLGLSTEDLVKRALDEIDGKISVFSGPASVPLKRLAELGVSRVSFGPGALGLTLAHLQRAATQLTALGGYPTELGYSY
jgi:2-methylisocitrate lyase-like PEP mutase family enzyme